MTCLDQQIVSRDLDARERQSDIARAMADYATAARTAISSNEELRRRLTRALRAMDAGDLAVGRYLVESVLRDLGGAL